MEQRYHHLCLHGEREFERDQIENWPRGGIVPELKEEIDEIGNLIYQEIVTKVGKNYVTLRRFGQTGEK